MQKIGIAICGSSGIDYVDPNHGMKVFRSKIQINAIEYVDYVDISNEQFYFLLESAKELHTSQISTGELINLIKEARSEGITDLIMITISSGLSGTYQNVRLAASDINGINVHVVDSKWVGFCEANLGLLAKEMINKNYSVEEIIEKIEYARDNSYIAFTVETLNYLRLNGRLSNSSAFVGNLLKIKPLMAVEDGIVVVKEKIRTKAKAVETLIDNFIQEIENKDVIPFLLYSNNYEELEEVKKVVLSKTNKIKDLNIYAIPPVIGVHAGPGALGVGYIPNIKL
jgi:DegV family protein with EDD domain